MNAHMLAAYATIYTAVVYRDPGPTPSVGLTDALAIEVLP